MISYPTGAGPMAVKIADLNNDSFPDVVVANFKGNTTSIYLGHGDGSFKWLTDLWNGPNAGTNDLAIADINHDHILDIVALNRRGGNIGVFLGQGNATFSEQMTFSTGYESTPTGLALGDLNNDTFLDIAAADHEKDKVYVLFGLGDGTFNKIYTFYTGNETGPYLLIIDDFNKDHRMDIAIGSGHSNSVGIYLSNGTGTFAEQVEYHVETGPFALVGDDFNGDGSIDIATANYDSNDISILLGSANGVFKKQEKNYPTGNGSAPYVIQSEDFNRDNYKDLIVPNSGTDNVGILLGRGNGKFNVMKTYPTGSGSYPVNVDVADLTIRKESSWLVSIEKN